MAFLTKKAYSVGDEHFDDRRAFEYFGFLDDVSEDGILLSRAPDSIIFKDDNHSQDSNIFATTHAEINATTQMAQTESAIEEESSDSKSLISSAKGFS